MPVMFAIYFCFFPVLHIVCSIFGLNLKKEIILIIRFFVVAILALEGKKAKKLACVCVCRCFACLLASRSFLVFLLARCVCKWLDFSIRSSHTHLRILHILNINMYIYVYLYGVSDWDDWFHSIIAVILACGAKRCVWRKNS